MKQDEVIGWLGGGSAGLTVAWTLFRDRLEDSRRRKNDQRNQDIDRVSLALSGFEDLVEQLRIENERGKVERAELMAQREIERADRSALLREIANLRLEVQMLRKALDDAGLPVPILKSVGQ